MVIVRSQHYFLGQINHILNEVQPKFEYIEYRVSQNESLNSIFRENKVNNREASLLEKNLKNNNSFKSLRAGQTLRFTVDRGNNTITNIIFPVNDIKKIELTRQIGTNKFIFKEILENLTKKTVFKEGKITQSLYKSAIDLKE